MFSLGKRSYNLPVPPFHVYFLKNNEVFPKRLYTVTRLCFHSGRVTLFILERRDFIDFDDRYVQVVHGCAVN
jgi:hypothetical protein